jgi:hypothetical protein
LTGFIKSEKIEIEPAKIFTGFFVAAFSSGDGFFLSAYTLPKPIPFVEYSSAITTPLEMVKRKKFNNI